MANNMNCPYECFIEVAKEETVDVLEITSRHELPKNYEMTFKNSTFINYNLFEEPWFEEIGRVDNEPVTPDSDTVINWGQLCSDSDSDLQIGSGTSSASWTDELESDGTLVLKDYYAKFEAALFKDVPCDDISKSNFKESLTWSQQTPHLRIIGKSIRPTLVDASEIPHEEGEEEIYAIHGEVVASSEFSSPSRISGIEEKLSRLTVDSGKEKLVEQVQNDVLDELFNSVWPELVKKIEPTVRKIVETRCNSYAKENYELPIKAESSKKLRNEETEARQPGGSRPKEGGMELALQVSPVPIRSKSGRGMSGRQPPLLVESGSNSRRPLPYVSFPRQAHPPRHLAALSAKSNRGTSSQLLANFDQRLTVENSELISSPSKARNGLLPPIENEVKIKSGNKRSNSAYLNTRNYVPPRLNSSRNKSGLLTPLEPTLHINNRRRDPVKQNEDKNYGASGLGGMKLKRRIKSTVPWK